MFVYLDLSQDISHPETQVDRDPVVEDLREQVHYLRAQRGAGPQPGDPPHHRRPHAADPAAGTAPPAGGSLRGARRARDDLGGAGEGEKLGRGVKKALRRVHSPGPGGVGCWGDKRRQLGISRKVSILRP